MGDDSPYNVENRTQIYADALQRRLTQMIFYFDFICVNLPLSAFICVLFLRNNLGQTIDCVFIERNVESGAFGVDAGPDHV